MVRGTGDFRLGVGYAVLQGYVLGRSARVAGVLLLGCLATPAHGASATKPPPKPAAGRASTWEDAERMRERLEAIPAASRGKADYEWTLDRFRAVYHANPADVHAPMSVFLVAQLLAEEGRTLHDPAALRAALGQYEFLRAQYPASSLRTAALMAEAQIDQNDLREPRTARERYRLLLKEAPRSSEAEEARAALDRMSGTRTETAPVTAMASEPPPPVVTTAAAATLGTAKGATPARDPLAAPVGSAVVPAAAGAEHKGLAQVTGIRHWSTPSYTRVVIDLGDNVTYEAARVPNPDRIYFDLHGTRLAAELVGKSFTVTDDGFLKRIRAAQFRNQMTRVVLDVNDVTEYSAFLLPDPYRLIIDIHGRATAGRRVTGSLPAEATVMRPGTEPKPATAAPLVDTPVPDTKAAKAKGTQEVASLSSQVDRVEATSKPTSKPIAAVVDLGGTADAPGAGAAPPVLAAGSKPKSKAKASGADGVAVGDAVPARAAVPTADGETSLVRALGLKVGRIVIDAGHGGHDSGTLGVDGLEEKDVVLDVALRLGKLLHDRLNAEIIYTRSDDTFIPLEDRTAIANKAQADLFLSIHANSSPDESARGVETYYLNFTTQQDALQVAARENAVSDQSIHQLSDLVKKIALKDKIEESREFAGDVEQGLYGGLQAGNGALKNRGVKKAPFVVLIGANMPSVLAEISFVTNPRDAKQLQRPEYRQRVAESLYKGVAKYASGLSSVRVPVERAAGAQPSRTVVP